jgi:hypothetical protein
VGGFSITSKGLQNIGYSIANIGFPTVIIQEGGYMMEVLGTSAVRFLSAFQ